MMMIMKMSLESLDKFTKDLKSIPNQCSHRQDDLPLCDRFAYLIDSFQMLMSSVIVQQATISNEQAAVTARLAEDTARQASASAEHVPDCVVAL
jgi:hypothetical protein